MNYASGSGSWLGRHWGWVLAAVGVVGVAAAFLVLAGDTDGQNEQDQEVLQPAGQATEGPAPTTSPPAQPSQTPAAVGPPDETPVEPSAPTSCEVYLGPSPTPNGDGSLDLPYPSATDAMADLDPGATLCLLAGRYDEPIVVTASGSDGAPVTVRGLEGASVHSIRVEADNVAVENFEVTGADQHDSVGVFIDGDGVSVRTNRIHDMVGIAIGCAQALRDEAPRCVNSAIVDNTITRIDGWGVWIWGEGNYVARNDISRVFADVSGDADGIRFFGADHEIRNNYIHDIYEADAGPDRAPHSDCFQTFDLEGTYPALSNVVISGNVCSTDRHGVIMTQLMGLPASNIRIENNVFLSDGVAAVLLLGDGVGPEEQYRGVSIVNNLIAGVVDFHGIQTANGAEVTIANNLFFGDFLPFSGTSLEDGRGSTTTNNLTATAADFTNTDDPDVRRRYRLAPTSAAIDAAAEDLAPASDLDEQPRPVDGNGDGSPVSDVGPYEYSPME
ncbi:MAG: right-handed parallel beta-helix repeat-containing protein [Acidimicrobiales bacterium]